MLRLALTLGAAAFYILAGTSHFLHPATYLKIMPPAIPWPKAMVYASGAAEISGGIALLIKPLRKPAVFGLIALLLAVFPANVYMAAQHIQVTSAPLPNWLLWARLPVQLLLIWWLVFLLGRSQSPVSSPLKS